MRLEQDCGEDVIEVGYRAMLEAPELSNRVMFTLEQFKEGCKDLDVWGFYDKEPVGMLLFKGNHLHIAILEEYQGKCGKIICKAFAKSLLKFGTIVAEVHFNNKRAILFVEKLGFELVEEIDEMLIYECSL